MLRRPNLDLLGRRAEATVGPNELILPDDVLAQLERIKEQVRQRARVYDDWGFGARMSRGLGISALFAGESGTGKTHGRRGARQRAATSTSTASTCPRWSASTSARPRRTCARVFDAAEDGGAILLLRRGRRAVRQAQRGQGQPRPLRQHRGQLPAAAHGGLPRPGDPHDQHEDGARPGVHAPAALRRRLPVPRPGRPRADLARAPSSPRWTPSSSTSSGWRSSSSPAAASTTSPSTRRLRLPHPRTRR